MVRIIQPAGFSKAPLVRIGLLEDVEEVILLCSPESMNDEEFERIQSVAKELGSKAKYTREIIRVLNTPVKEIINELITFRNTLEEKETFISITGSTNLLVHCMLHTFPDYGTISMNVSQSTYSLSTGVTSEMQPFSDERIWSLYGLKLEKRGTEINILSDGKIIAKPMNVSIERGKLLIEWKWTKDTAKIKQISGEMGRLCRINSEDTYNFKVHPSNVERTVVDRYPMNVDRSIKKPGLDIPELSDNLFERLSLPDFSLDLHHNEGDCLHVILNKGDLIPTAFSIMLHEPKRVVLWILEEDKPENLSSVTQGRIDLLTSFISGKIDTKFEAWMKTPLLKSFSRPDLNIDFQLMCIQSLQQEITSLPLIAFTENSIVDVTSGFPAFHEKICSTLKMHNLNYSKWYTDSTFFRADEISLNGNSLIKEYPNYSHWILRKRIPFSVTILSQEESDIQSFRTVLSCFLENKLIHHTGQVTPPYGVFVNEEGIEIEITKPEETDRSFPIWWDVYVKSKEDFHCSFDPGPDNNAGTWLETLGAQMIHTFWNSRHSAVGFRSKPISGMLELGSIDDIDIHCITEDGVLIGDAKALTEFTYGGQKVIQSSNNTAIDIAFSSPVRVENKKGKYIITPEGKEKRLNITSDLEFIIGQVMGEVAVIGNRRGQIPILVISIDSSPFDEIARINRIIICSWWELQYPERIMHRFKTGKRSEEELAEIADLNAKVAAAKEAEKKAKEAEKKAKEAEKKFKKPAFVHPAFWKEMTDQASFLEKPIEEQKRLSNENKEERRKNRVTPPKVEQNSLFAGTVNHEQFKLLDGGHKKTISISGVEELKGVIIAIPKPKHKTLFGETGDAVTEREEANGYDIRVVDISLKPENLATGENVTAYLRDCYPILSDDEKEES